LNADKSKYPGCCWEASRLPDPKCNEATFMDGAVTDLTLNIGLYGQLVMTLPSVNTVVVGFGRDLRPIEPARIGYYPGVCKALGIPCNNPPPVPKTKCGELLECTGVSAQCFSGGSWSHAEPKPGKEQCVSCFQNRLPYYEQLFPEAQYMVKNWCPQSMQAAMPYIACFCGLTGVNANPFAPWPTTTTTTPAPSPAPPPPPPRPTPAPPAPGLPCGLTAKCIKGLTSQYDCWDMARNSGHNCYRGINLHQDVLRSEYGCPNFTDNTTVIQSKAFCWCGYDPTPSAGLDLHVPFPHPLVRSKTSTSFSFGKALCGLCHNSKDYHKIKRIPQPVIDAMLESCAQAQFGSQHESGTTCMMIRLGMISYPCAICFGNVINCGHTHCLEQCACGLTSACHRCVERLCKPAFNFCSGNKKVSYLTHEEVFSHNLSVMPSSVSPPNGSQDQYVQLV
jgi:hypothetical protein